MRALVQRVTQAEVAVVTPEGSRTTGRIGPGLAVLVGVTHTDDAAVAARLAAKLWHLRVFPDADGVMNRSVAEAGGELLVVSQFTLYGDARRGRRPTYAAAAPPEQAEPLLAAVVAELEALGARVATGVFRAQMAVSLINDGPVTLMVEL